MCVVNKGAKHQYKGLNFSSTKTIFHARCFHNFSTKNKNVRQSTLRRTFFVKIFFPENFSSNFRGFFGDFLEGNFWSRSVGIAITPPRRQKNYRVTMASISTLAPIGSLATS